MSMQGEKVEEDGSVERIKASSVATVSTDPHNYHRPNCIVEDGWKSFSNTKESETHRPH